MLSQAKIVSVTSSIFMVFLPVGQGESGMKSGSGEFLADIFAHAKHLLEEVACQRLISSANVMCKAPLGPRGKSSAEKEDIPVCASSKASWSAVVALDVKGRP